MRISSKQHASVHKTRYTQPGCAGVHTSPLPLKPRLHTHSAAPTADSTQCAFTSAHVVTVHTPCVASAFGCSSSPKGQSRTCSLLFTLVYTAVCSLYQAPIRRECTVVRDCIHIRIGHAHTRARRVERVRRRPARTRPHCYYCVHTDTHTCNRSRH
jgi:hypothetical protein